MINLPLVINSFNKSNICYKTQRCEFFLSQKGVGMKQWWEHSHPTNVARARFPDSALYVGWVCCWFSSLLWEVFLRFSPLLKNQFLQIAIRSGLLSSTLCKHSPCYGHQINYFLLLKQALCGFLKVRKVIFIAFTYILFLFVGDLHASHRGCFEYFTVPCKVCPFYLTTEQFTNKSCQNCWESSVNCGFILPNDREQSSRNGLVGVYYYY